MPQYTTKQDFLRYNIFPSYFIDRRVFFREFAFQYASMKTQKSRVLIREKITALLRKITERDQLRVSPQSSPRINHMLTTSLTRIQWKSSPFLFPVPSSPLGTPGRPTSLLCPKYEEEKRLADYDSRRYATSSKKNWTWHTLFFLKWFCFSGPGWILSFFLRF